MKSLGAVLLVVLSACTTAPERAVTIIGNVGPSIRYLALGDSYTIGESVDPEGRWPDQLGRRLESSGFSFVDVQIVARTGWTTSELALGIDRADPQGPFDLVTLLIGVNNQFRGLGAEDYRSEFVVLLDRAIGLAGGDPSRVIVVSIPDWGATPFGSTYDSVRVAQEIDAFNAIGRDEAAGADAEWVDITAISRGGGPELVAVDGLHPSGAQYAAWAELILPLALEALSD